MNVLVQGEVVEDHENLVAIKLDVGYGDPVIQASKDKIVKKVIGCAYCGHPTPIVEGFNQALIDHIVNCDKHPMGRMAAALVFAGEVLEAAEHALTVRQGMVCDFEKVEPTGPSECKMMDTETLTKIDLALKACGRRKP